MKALITCILLFSLMGFAGDPHPGLMDPSKATEKAPDTYRVEIKTTKGDFTLKITREWSPLGADRFYNLVKIGYFKDIGFYRVISGFMTQFGFHGDPEVNKVWADHSIDDDPPKMSNTIGRISFANRGPDTRSCQLFINTVNNPRLDPYGFTPFGEVEGDGLTVVKSLFSGYGEGIPRGRGPSQPIMKARGNAYLKESFPKLDYILSARIIK